MDRMYTPDQRRYKIRIGCRSDADAVSLIHKILIRTNNRDKINYVTDNVPIIILNMVDSVIRIQPL